MAIKFVLVEIVLVETVLVGDPLYMKLFTIWIFGYPKMTGYLCIWISNYPDTTSLHTWKRLSGFSSVQIDAY